MPFWKVMHPAGLVRDPGTGWTPAKFGGLQDGLVGEQVVPAKVVYRPSWLPPSPAGAS